ncbi:unnamed protein product [Mytilus coruscus]|uniref:C2H2-type domain-containing protein n=1 Tax=Mytilus coruscus TaxID=42192 RepID=A0A6J8BQV4_MYTCO|nr:unnamed protein product [Mytilus coruscus]
MGLLVNEIDSNGPTGKMPKLPKKPKQRLSDIYGLKKVNKEKMTPQELHQYLSDNIADINHTISRETFGYAYLLSGNETYLYPVVKNKQRVTNYKEYEDEISMRGIEYPVAKEDIPKVEKQNNLIINVFALKDQTNKQTLDPIYVSNKESEKCYVVDLLYIENNGNAHYCLIKDLDSFMCDNNGHKQFTCRNCIQGFQREETLEKHKKYVMITNLVEP